MSCRNSETFNRSCVIGFPLSYIPKYCAKGEKGPKILLVTAFNIWIYMYNCFQPGFPDESYNREKTVSLAKLIYI
jgi:hypothetical protein